LKNGVAVIKLDSPNSKVNTLNVETMNEVKKIMQVVSSNSDIHAAVLISGIAKEMIFILFFVIKLSIFFLLQESLAVL
jgi:hypothetical protein